MRTLVRRLEQTLERDSRGSEVARLLEEYAQAHEDWRDFAHFQDSCYARNLVRGCELFELLVICWRGDQVSPIHDHQGQRCWMAVLDGGIRETQFQLPGPGERGLKPGRRRLFQPGSVGFISDEIALHEIAPAGDRSAVSLHLYSRPIRECRIFDRDTGQVSMRGLAYHSVEGVVQSAGTG